jgi:DNA-binding response OmpR family regulator
VHRIILVEDEPMILMMLEDMLTDLGHQVVGSALRLADGVRLAEAALFDLAVIDVNLGNETSGPIVTILRRREIPFIVATAYPREVLASEYVDAVLLRKPFMIADLLEAISLTLI